MQSPDERVVALLLPGLHGTGVLFDEVVSRCPPAFEPKVVSYPCEQTLSVAELETIVVEQLPKDRPFVLVAESFSGPVALRVAAGRPENLMCVVLAASFAIAPRSRIWRMLPWELILGIPAPSFVLRRIASVNDVFTCQQLREAVQMIPPSVLADRVRATLQCDVTDQLKRVNCPIVYIQAADDLVVPKRCLRDILHQRKDVVVEELKAKHLVLQEHPGAVWNILQRALPDAGAA